MKKLILPLFIIALGLLIGGCQPLASLLPQTQPLTLTIDQIAPDSTPGQYVLFGQTSLPDDTVLTVSAMRPLTSSSPAVTLSETVLPDTLARQSVTVEEGRWQAQLKLWQVSLEGRYQENWQMQKTISARSLSPDQDVVFAVTLSPIALLQSTQKTLKDARQLGDNPIFNVTPTGEPYLEARKLLSVPLPNGNQTATAIPANAVDSPWADRSVQNRTETSFAQPPSLPFMETDNLPVPTNHRLQ
jgi:hypothetical protein